MVTVPPRVFERHPELWEAEILSAWEHPIVTDLRSSEGEKRYYAVLGLARSGRILEMIAVAVNGDEDMLIYHALTPPTKKFLRELGLI